MSWSYNAACEAPKDQVRFLLGDTTPAQPLAQDEEIGFAIRTEANVYMAAAMVADQLATQSRGLKSRTTGSLSRTFGPEHWTNRAAALRMRGSAHQMVSCGGLRLSQKELQQLDSDLVQPPIAVDMHTNVRT